MLTRKDLYDPLSDLKKYHTKVLLYMLNISRKCGGWYSICGYGGHGYTTEQLKIELATREHIPNKLESRRIRQRAARGSK